MPKIPLLLALGLVLGPVGCTPRPIQPVMAAPADRGGVPGGARDLLDAMSSGTYAGQLFPALTWDDVPDLLAAGGSTREVTAFPRNPSSSQYEPSCSEGMVALWLVEGIRAGGKFASLNALCFSRAMAEGNWAAASETNHDRVVAAYQEWWSRARTLPREQAASLDPLSRTGLHWY